jgi:hypothetical protein
VNAVAWVLVAWGVAAIIGGAVATWFGWHLNRSRHAEYRRRTARNRAHEEEP